MPAPKPPVDVFQDIRFPERGVDVSQGYGSQPKHTTITGTNVLTYEPSTDRSRGGSRAGLVKFLTDQLPHSYTSGSRLIQNLNIVIISDGESLLGKFDPPPLDPVTGLPPVDDPSSPGPPSSWGTGILAPGPPPITGTTLMTRAPGSPTGGPRRVRKGGTARTPNKNVLTRAGTTGLIYWGEATYTFTGGSFGGQSASFTSAQCYGGLVPAPTNPEDVIGISAQLGNFLAFLSATGQTYDSYALTESHWIIQGTVVCSL